ncbi:MAG: hypothetical protein HYT40_01500 [Candidatus Sungbacteria bacterium]|uniref:HTH HARE-type domain-containing protein n=1 Tax=Candidatus Sungiibacteriota bacterium TaxID=2750080 RepID=A0A931SBF5_9BACT|nr:hypothetical protein [Candidatus Sungbacteria bacterium]
MLQPIKVALKPREVTQRLLKEIENKRVREVLERRFGLKDGKRETLEAIGTSYGITRERVRQIEADGLRVLARPAVYGLAESVFRALEDHLEEHGHIAREEQLLESVAGERERAPAAFLLTVGKQFQKAPETEKHYDHWYTRKEAKAAAEKILAEVVRDLGERKSPVNAEALSGILGTHAERVLGAKPKEQVLQTYLGISKLIAQNPYGEYGLVSWPTIRPKGVRDKSYVVLQKAGKPMHFREVANAINTMQWTKKPAHPQTVHNELIKASDRFVLVGRGLYALREWGYTPGTVSDVMQEILKDAKGPLPKEEMVKRVLEKRFVKANTILLNLQNRSLFQKTPEGKYFLV